MSLGHWTRQPGWAFALAATSALAQTQPEATPTQEIEEIIVTGTYLRATDAGLAAPVTTITAEQIQASGLTSVTDVVRTLPADNMGSLPTGFTNGFAVGAAGVALRGLTVNSTLVLVNGRRVAAYAFSDDGQRSFVDLNTLPLNAVDRIEALRDGASSLYGADAIAGVVNLILNKHYTGSDVTGEVGTSEHSGGTMTRLTGKFGRGDIASDGQNAFVSVEWQNDTAIHVTSRDFPFNSNDLTSIGGLNTQWGRPGTFTGTPYATVQPATLSIPGDLTSGVPLPGSLVETLRPCGSNAYSHSDENGSYCTMDQARYADVQPAQERLGVYGRFTTQFNEHTQAYVDATYSWNQITGVIWPSQVNAGSPRNTNSLALPITVPGPDGKPILNPNNPFAAAGQYALINYAFDDIFRSATTTSNFARVVADVTGRLWGWDYDSAIVLNHTWLDYENIGTLSYAGLMSAVANGTYDFVDPSRNSTAVRDLVSPNRRFTATTDLYSVDLRGTRNAGSLPGGPIGVALGLEGRYEAQDNPGYNADLDWHGWGIAKTIGSRYVFAAFAEIYAPVLDSLSFNVSGRYDEYSDFGGHFSPKISLTWTPVQQLALRAAYSSGFRAPSFAENSDSIFEGFALSTPPSDWAATHGNNAYTLPYMIGFIVAPNPDITPEESESATLNVVWSPSHWISIAAGYYAIEQTDKIVQSSPGEILNAAFAGQPAPPGSTIIYDAPDPMYPDAVPRPLAVGAPYVNANSLETDGIDVEITANIDLPGGGRFTSNLGATKILSWTQTFDGNPPTTLQFAGTHGPYIVSSGAGMPEYRGVWANTVSLGRATVTATAYYTSDFYMSAPDFTYDQSCFSTGSSAPNFPADCTVDSFVYVDLTGTYRFGDHLTASFAIMNLFDNEPPVDPINYAAVNYNPTYHQAGIVGRFWKLGVAYRF